MEACRVREGSRTTDRGLLVLLEIIFDKAKDERRLVRGKGGGEVQISL